MDKKRLPKKSAKPQEPQKNELAELFAANPKQKAVVSVLFLDRSGSMAKYCQATPVPQNAVNKHLGQLKQRHDEQAYYAAVVTFADDFKVEVPLGPVGPELEHYSPDGQTLLYSTVYHGISDLLDKYRALTKKQQKALRIVIGVITDGLDNLSDRVKYPLQLQQLAAEVTILGWEFLTFGIGVNAQALAGLMGLQTDSDHAITLTNEARSVAQATEHFTSVTIIAPVNLQPSGSQR